MPQTPKILNIIKLPDPILREASSPLERVDEDVRALADNMLETMYDAPGVGLAGIQVGVPRRILVFDTAREEEERNPVVMINPEIVQLSDEPNVYEEGCLSIPDMYAEVERPDAVRVRFLDREGTQLEQHFDELAATVIQHEIDHLDGKLFIDHLSRLRRDRLVKKFLKAQKEAEVL